tara:strand:+ start:964 stop:1332 length:369 start_codon:yes stop_codon:yes gene_type:complete
MNPSNALIEQSITLLDFFLPNSGLEKLGFPSPCHIPDQHLAEARYNCWNSFPIYRKLGVLHGAVMKINPAGEPRPISPRELQKLMKLADTKTLDKFLENQQQIALSKDAITNFLESIKQDSV